jgi:hypothetical protein
VRWNPENPAIILTLNRMGKNNVQVIVTTPFSIYRYPSDFVTNNRPDIKTRDDYMNHMYSDDRLNTKFNAFERVTVPSINGQTYKNYTWQVVHSPHLPEKYMDRLQRIAQITPNMKLISVNDFSELNSTVSDLLPPSNFINVRLDDDDALHPGYFSLLAKHYTPGIVLSPVNGYKLTNYDHTKKRGKASIFKYPPRTCAASGLAIADDNVNRLGKYDNVHLRNKNIKYLTHKGLFLRMMHDHNFVTAKKKGKKFPISVKKYIKGTRKHTKKHLQKGGGEPEVSEGSGEPELGEGRSKSIYIKPASTDLAVLLVFYNPVGFNRILDNILYVIKTLKEKNIPYFVAECVFDGKKPQIPDATIVLHSNSYMFYKEQLINNLEKHVPEKYTKLMLMDGDIIFDSPDWVDQVSVSLDTNDVIQPFDKACWLMPGNKIIRSWKYSYAHALTKNIEINYQNIHIYHPGFAWAFKRSTFRQLGGLYPNAIIGGGDMLFTFNFFVDEIPDYWFKDSMVTKIPIEAWPAYHKNFKKVAPKVGVIEIRALHLFHGLSLNRQYRTRYQKFADMLNMKWDECIVMNKDNLTEFKDPELRHRLLPYFKERNEDIPLNEAIKVSQQTVKTIATNETTEPLTALNAEISPA